MGEVSGVFEEEEWGEDKMSGTVCVAYVDKDDIEQIVIFDDIEDFHEAEKLRMELVKECEREGTEIGWRMLFDWWETMGVTFTLADIDHVIGVSNIIGDDDAE